MTRAILIVEDNQAERQRLLDLLAGNGYTVTGASTGLQALEAVKRSKPDAILMDVNMPEMDGFAATRALLRGDADTRDIPVIIVSAKDQKADRAWAQMLGARGYITKPFTDEQVLTQVRAI